MKYKEGGMKRKNIDDRKYNEIANKDKKEKKGKDRRSTERKKKKKG